MVGEKYLTALVDASGGLPWMLPLLDDASILEAVLDRVDGVFLTGSYSNVEPMHYGGEASRPGTLHDPERDATTLPLIRRALDRGLPLFAVCRGFQEVNVALGGTLHQHVEEVPGLNDHRENPDDPLDVQYGPAHAVNLVQGGLLYRLHGELRVDVNSLHSQGVARLAPGLTVEAIADDGLVEAFTIDAGDSFALAVQWHPEWKATENRLSAELFNAFGEAARRYAAERPAREHTNSLLEDLGTAGEA
jgi:putative glutamine amidotransferase